MSEKKKVTFQARAGEPMTLEVKGTDGSAYELQVTLAVFNIYETGNKTPAQPPDTGTVPEFQIEAQVATITRRKAL